MDELDLERKGSVRHRSSKRIHPLPVSGPPHLHLPAALATPEKGRIPLLIPLIVVACIVMFVITMYVNNCPVESRENVEGCVLKFLGRFSFQPFRENPLLGPSAIALHKVGALDAASNVKNENQGWRLVSSVWLHAGVFHIAANMLGLLVIGITLEQEFGFFKISIIYLLSGLGGNLLSSLFLIQGHISVGASGAVFGLLGAMLSELITNWTVYEGKCRVLITLIVVVVLNLAVGILPFVDNFAHYGGLIVGFLTGFILLMKPQPNYIKHASTLPNYTGAEPQRKWKHKIYQYVLMVVALIILIVSMSVVMVLVLRGVDGNEKCWWCHYLSCVSTSKWQCDNVVKNCDTITTNNVTFQIACTLNNHIYRTTTITNESDVNAICVQLCGT